MYQNGPTTWNKRYTWYSNANNSSDQYVATLTENTWNTWVLQKPILASGVNAMAAAFDMETHTINNVTDPTLATQAATKNYVDLGRTYLQVAPTNMTSNTAPTPYVVTAVNINGNAAYAPWKAFDGDSTTWWATSGGGV
jgi:hypothetical protein